MNLFKRCRLLENSGIFQDFIDYHCHILPGVDDGVRTMNETLQILQEYERLGIREVWLTPHVMEDTPNTSHALIWQFEMLKYAYQGTVVLHLSAEYMLDNLFEERLNQNDLLPMGEKGNHLLVETSYFNPPVRFHDILSRIKAKGFHPVLAHPERYLYLEETEYRQLKSMGIRFQLNLFSLYGLYGKNVRKRAEHLKAKAMYEYVGTDLHRLETLTSMFPKKQ